jgi:hypothetical protein
MIYKYLYIMVSDACRLMTWASGRGVGPWKSQYFWAPKALAYQLDAISQGPKSSLLPGINPLPLALVMDLTESKILCMGPYK